MLWLLLAFGLGLWARPRLEAWWADRFYEHDPY